MKKIINGRRYDTDTAEFIGAGSSDYAVNDFNYFKEDLYLKKTGEYFIHGMGNAGSKYAESTGYNTHKGSERLIPLTEDEAKSWVEKYLDADEYEKLFELESEDEEVVRQSISMSADLNAKLREAARLDGQSISQIVNDAVEKYLEELDLGKKYYVVADDCSEHGGGEAFFIAAQFDNEEDAINEAQWYYEKHLVESERRKTNVFVATDIVDDVDRGIFEWRTVWSAKED